MAEQLEEALRERALQVMTQHQAGAAELCTRARIGAIACVE